MKCLEGFLRSCAFALLPKFPYHVTSSLCWCRIILELLVVQYRLRNLDQLLSMLLSIFIDLETEISNSISSAGLTTALTLLISDIVQRLRALTRAGFLRKTSWRCVRVRWRIKPSSCSVIVTWRRPYSLLCLGFQIKLRWSCICRYCKVEDRRCTLLTSSAGFFS